MLLLQLVPHRVGLHEAHCASPHTSTSATPVQHS